MNTAKSLRNVRGNRDSGASHLSDQSVALVGWETAGHLVDVDDDSSPVLPNLQIPKISYPHSACREECVRHRRFPLLVGWQVAACRWPPSNGHANCDRRPTTDDRRPTTDN